MGIRDKVNWVYEYKYLVVVLTLCISFSFSFYYIFDNKVDLNGDNAKYYLVAKSIAQGKGYVSVYSPGEPPTSVYPPGYPTLMSGVMVFTESVKAQKVLNGVFLLLSSILLFFTLNNFVDNKIVTFFVSFLTVVNFHLLKFSTMMMSEVSFLLFSILSLYLFTRIKEEKHWNDLYYYLFILSLSFSFHIRTQGIGLVGGFLFYYLFKKQWKHLSVTAIGFVLLALPWRIRNHIQELGSSRYLDQLVQANPWRPEQGEVSIFGLLERVVNQGTMIVTKAIPDSIFNFVTANYQGDILAGEWILGILVLVIMSYGFWSVKRYRLLLIGYFLAVFSIVASWSATVDNRYLITIIPFMQFGFFYGFYVLADKLLNYLKFDGYGAIKVLFLVLGLAMIPRLDGLRARAERSYPKAYYNYFQSANEIGQKLNCKDTLFSCRKPALFYLFSNCHATKYKMSKDKEEVLKDMLDEGIDYVVLEQLGFGSTARYLYPAIKKYNNVFAPVIHKENPDTYILKLNKKKARSILEGE